MVNGPYPPLSCPFRRAGRFTRAIDPTGALAGDGRSTVEQPCGRVRGLGRGVLRSAGSWREGGRKGRHDRIPGGGGGVGEAWERGGVRTGTAMSRADQGRGGTGPGPTRAGA